MNKNWLFGTTALALAASFGAIAPANAQAFKTNNTEVTIGGYSRGFVGGVSADRTTASRKRSSTSRRASKASSWSPAGPRKLRQAATRNSPA